MNFQKNKELLNQLEQKCLTRAICDILSAFCPDNANEKYLLWKNLFEHNSEFRITIKNKKDEFIRNKSISNRTSQKE